MPEAMARAAGVSENVDDDSGVGALRPGIAGRPILRRFSIERRRVVDRINAATEAQLVLVRGAAGSGKTVALAEWAASESDGGNRVGAWVTIDEETSERVDAWSKVASRVDSSAGRVDPTNRLAAADHLADPTRVVPAEAGVLVFDDVHKISDQDGFALDVERILLRRPRLTIVLIGRGRTPFEETSAGGRIDIERLDVDLLRFSEDEVGVALTARGIRFDSGVVQYLAGALEGWPLAVGRLVNSLSLEDRRVWHPVDLGLVVGPLLMSLTAELTCELRSGTLAADLGSISILPFLTIDLAARLLEISSEESARLVGALEMAGIGTWRRSFGHDRFVLLSIVKGGLLGELEVGDGPARARRYESVGAHLLEGQGPGATWDALQLARSAEDWAHLSSISLRFHALLCRDHFDDLQDLLDDLPRDVTEADPWLLFLKGALWVASEGGRSSSSTAFFSRAESVARDRIREASGSDSLTLSLLRVACLRRCGAYGRSSALARSLQEIVDGPRPKGSPLLESLVAEGQLQLGLTFLYDGAYSEALERFARVVSESRADGHTRIAARGYAALIRAFRGELVVAASVLEVLDADPAWPEWDHTVWGVPAHLARAILAMEQQNQSEAGRHLRIVAGLGVDVEDWPLITYVRGLHQLVTGTGAEGFATIRDEEGRRGHDQVSNHLQGLLFVLKSDFLLLGRQARSALPALKPFVDGRESVVGAHARALLLSGNPVHARLFVDRLVWRDRLSPRSQLELQVVKAVASHRLGDRAGAKEALGIAAGITATHRIHVPWSLVPRDELQKVVEGNEPGLNRVLQIAAPVFSGGLTVPALTRRERVVLSHLRGPGSLEDIALGLHVSTNTIKTQVQSVYRKLGVRSRRDAVRVAYEWRLLGGGDSDDRDA